MLVLEEGDGGAHVVVPLKEENRDGCACVGAVVEEEGKPPILRLLLLKVRDC